MREMTLTLEEGEAITIHSPDDMLPSVFVLYEKGKISVSAMVVAKIGTVDACQLELEKGDQTIKWPASGREEYSGRVDQPD